MPGTIIERHLNNTTFRSASKVDRNMKNGMLKFITEGHILVPKLVFLRTSLTGFV